VISDFHVVRWVEIEKRATACREVGFKGAALRGWNAARSRRGSSICIQFDGRSLSREVFGDFKQCGSIASARIHCEERFRRYQELAEVARFFDGQRVMTEFQTPCIADGRAPFFWDSVCFDLNQGLPNGNVEVYFGARLIKGGGGDAGHDAVKFH